MNMAGNPYDREILNPLERPLADDINEAQSQLDRSLRDTLRQLFSTNPLSGTNGFVSGSFQVTQTGSPSMNVLVSPGIGFYDAPSDCPTSISGIVGLDDLSPYKPMPLVAAQTIAVDASPSPGQSRIDIIEVRYNRAVGNSTTRDILNTGTGIFAPGLLNKTLAFDLDGLTGRVVSPASSTAAIGYKVGVAATTGSQVAPTGTTGYTTICQILVTGGVTTIVTANITDERPILSALTPGSITTADLANGAVTTAKIAALNITSALIAAGAVGTTQLAAASVTIPKLAASNTVVSSDSGNFSTSSLTPVNVTNLNATITTSGRPVLVVIQGSGSTNSFFAGTNSNLFVEIDRDGSTIAGYNLLGEASSTPLTSLSVPANLFHIDAPSAGTHTYQVKLSMGAGGTNAVVNEAVLRVTELG
jgi:hypothetical protein